MIPEPIVQLAYLLSASLFIIGLKWLSSAKTARNGNLISGIGMVIAIAVTLFDREIVTYGAIAAGILVGSAIGIWMARTVKMTAMPQMVSILIAAGGAASLLVGAAALLRAEVAGESLHVGEAIAIQLDLLIGAVTFTGSIIAYAKLQEIMTGQPIIFPGLKWLNPLLFVAIVALSIYQLVMPPPLLWPFMTVIALSLILGVLLVIPIGGADMPVVISLLNSYSGLAAAMTGFVIQNQVLIIAGAMVGSSGIILSQIMCRALNRRGQGVGVRPRGSSPSRRASRMWRSSSRMRGSCW
jgi:NAD(P) transhydrogenase subunit beta